MSSPSMVDLNQHSLTTRQRCSFFEESIVYPSIQPVQVKGWVTIWKNEKSNIVNFVWATGMISF